MLECTLDFLNSKCWPPDVDVRLLRVLHRQSETRLLVLQVSPATLLLAEVRAFLANRDAYAFVIEHHTIQFKKLNKMHAEVHLVSSSLLVAPLEVARHQHRQQERANATVIRLVQLSTF